MLPLDLPKTNTPRLNLNIKINPIEILLCFIEDHLSIVLNSPLKLNVNTLNGILPYASLVMNKFLINLNDSEILTMQSLYFILDKNIDINIPLVTVMLSMTQVYKLIKMLSNILQNSFINVFFVQRKIAINNIPIKKIICKIANVHVLMQQTKSRRNITLNFEKTEFYLKNMDDKAELCGQTIGKFTASDGFLSFDITQSFNIIINGELSETMKNCSIKVQDPIIFEITTFTINQILKNLTATEDDAEKQYSISNETGVTISIIINNTEYIY